MPSPFPGMNPYLEQDYWWQDFHITFTVHMANALTAQIRPRYFTNISTYDFRHDPVDVEKHRFLEIRICQNRELVTVIEMLSPANKALGRFRDQYAKRRLSLMQSNTHFVEIDLLRGGPRMLGPQAPESDYAALVHRAGDANLAYWPSDLRDSLPTIPVPLRSPDPDTVLDLQACLHRAFESGRYDLYIYDSQPEPPLRPEDAAWAAALISRKS